MTTSYIIRICRYASSSKPAHRLEIDGLVEDASGNKCQAFHNMEELWSILNRQPQPKKSLSTTSQSNK